ncbi:MAG: hypothetical protein ATN32_07680 [Candidatus Epulonipiscium fishelsonii]|nr:MAG: hypothetical protein ATN32_07680 [Epulopiscium sp. AS2M-Bin002]
MKKIKISVVDTFEQDEAICLKLLKILNLKYEIIWAREIEEADYVFFSDDGFSHLSFNSIRIYFSSKDLFPDFNLCDYALGVPSLSWADRYFKLENKIDEEYEERLKAFLYNIFDQPIYKAERKDKFMFMKMYEILIRKSSINKNANDILELNLEKDLEKLKYYSNILEQSKI